MRGFSGLGSLAQQRRPFPTGAISQARLPSLASLGAECL